MANKVVVHVPSMADGEPIEVLYLGMFENGKTSEVTDEQVAQYEGSAQRKFPKSGYLFAGTPKGDAQEKAFAANQKEGVVSTRNEEIVPTKIEAAQSNPQTDNVEGSTVAKEGEK